MKGQKLQQNPNAIPVSTYFWFKETTHNSTFSITQEEKRLLIISVFTRLAINPFYRFVLVSKYIHAFPSFWSVLCTPAGTPHSHHCRHCQIVLAMASCGNSFLSIQPFMPSNIICSITLPLMFKSVAKHLFLVVRLMCRLTTFPPLISSPNYISSTWLHMIEVHLHHINQNVLPETSKPLHCLH